MLRKLSRKKKTFQTNRNEEKEEKDSVVLDVMLQPPKEIKLQDVQKKVKSTSKLNKEMSELLPNKITEFKNKLQYDPFPILKQQLENGKMSDLRKDAGKKWDEEMKDPNVINFKLLKCEVQSEIDSDNKENATHDSKDPLPINSSFNDELPNEDQQIVPVSSIDNQTPILKTFSSIYGNNLQQNFEDDFENKPCDLSMKSELKFKKNEESATISKDASLNGIIKNETYNNVSDCDSDDEDNNDNSHFDTKFDGLSTQQQEQQQQLVLAHLSKIQQHFVSNLLQYQANFLAHYQQIQQRMMLQCNSNNDNSSQDAKCTTDDIQDICSESDDDDKKEKSASLLPPPLIPVALLGNLVPYALYRHLLPTSSEHPSLANLLSNSSAFQQDEESERDDNSEEDSNSSPTSHLPASLIQQLIEKSDEFSSSKLSDLSSNKKYSLLSSLIRSSKLKNESISSIKQEEGVDESGNSNFQFKRKRIAFSAKQYELLQTTFEHNNFPEPGDQQCIARQLKAPYRSIKMWFQNKRANARKKLFPGEKGSGRTATGEKIPGDTDTRFYCDKCPSAFICQKYLRNHLDAHKVYTIRCTKCRVTFTHDCLLNTHTISKCGKKEDKLSKREMEDKEEGIKEEQEEVQELEEEEAFLKINGLNEKRSYSQRDVDDEKMDDNILAHLNSSLPLLTLLQIQKTKAEQNLEEQMDEQDQSSEEEMEEDSEEHNISTNVTNKNESSIPNNNEDCNPKPTPPKQVPPLIKAEVPALIPTEFVKPFVNNVTKFAILRQLLTNFEQKSLDLSKNGGYVSDEEEQNPSNSKVSILNLEEEKDVRLSESEFKPKNIPEHLHDLLTSRNGTFYQFKNNAEGSNEIIDSQLASALNDIDTNEKRTLEALFDEKEEKQETKSNNGSKPKRLRRRTTVFTENQHRVLYLHFTHCNFPDPSMFRILSRLTGLTPHVIKIWFQNERSRQRRQVHNAEVEGVSRDKKPYKCRDCGVEFAMPAFLVKHCMRHIPTENVTSQARKCPICMVEFETQKLHSHFMASHNLSINMEEEGTNEENICHLCKEHFSDLNTLSIHKNEHLKDTQYGDPPQCVECKTTFVNVLCLEAHMATHYKFKWDHTCPKCKMRFYDKILLESHLISHTMHSSNNNSKSVSAATNDSQSQFLISLIKKIADSENEAIKTADSANCKQEDSENSEIKIKKVQSDKNDLSSMNGHDTNLSQGKPSLSASLSTSLSNVSLKFIPVKFVPTVPSYSQVNNSNDANPVVTVISSQFLSSGIKDPQISINTLGGPTVTNNSNPVTKNMCLSVNEERVTIENVTTSSSKRKVPNLIPISKAGVPLRTFNQEEAVMKESSDYSHRKESSDEIEIKEIDETSEGQFQSEETPDSQVLVYTPYASEYRKRRRTPTHFNSSQRDILEAYYKYDNFPDPNEQLHLSEYLKVPYSVIKTWYQNTRKNHRKHLKESLNFEVGGPFECLDCRVCFVSKIYLESHIRQHKEKQPYSCQQCLKQFPHQAVFDIHVRMGCSKKSKKKHEQIRPFSSLTRTFKLSEKEESTKEINKVTVPDSFPRIINSYGNKRKLSSSSKESNTKYLKFEYNCVPEEKKIASLPMDGNEDINSGSMVKDEHFKCDNCHSQFGSLQLYNDHHCSNFVPQVLGYKCPVCEKTFQSFLSIAEHKEKRCKKLLPILPALKILTSEDTHRRTHRQPSKLVCSELIHLYPPGNKTRNRYQENKTNEGSTGTKMREKLGLSRSNICFLQVHYKYNNFPSVKEMESMSKRLGIEREKVEHWFLRQRARERKSHLVGYKNPRECKSCTSVFVHNDALQKHEETVHNPSTISIEFVCPQEACQAKYPNATLLQTHQIEHCNEKATGDEKTMNSLLQHLIPLEMHYKENNFPSPFEVSFIAKRLLLDLVDVHWWFKQRREEQIAALNSSATTTASTSPHQSTLSPCSRSSISGQNRECLVCFAAFVKEDLLTNHQIIHSINCSLVCWECGYDFASPLVLKTHMLQHGYIVPNDVLSSSKVLLVSSFEMKYTFIQLQVLYNHFKLTNFPKKEEIKLISRRLKVPMKHVQTWFKHQRSSEIGYSKSSLGKQSCMASIDTQNILGETSNGHSFPSITSSGRSSKTSHGVSGSRLESVSLGCNLCPSEFVSARLLDRHKAIHALGCNFACESCSSTFLHEMVRDTHTLSHSIKGSSDNASELELKAKSKVLEKETKTLLKNLILTCKDIHVPTMPVKSNQNTTPQHKITSSEYDNTVMGAISQNFVVTGYENDTGTHRDKKSSSQRDKSPPQGEISDPHDDKSSYRDEKSPLRSEMSPPQNLDSQPMITEPLKYDSDNDEEDDEVKLVIDE